MTELLLAVVLPLIPQPREIASSQSFGEEGYRLEIRGGQPIISAPTELGRHWARVTFDQLCARGELRDQIITDAPKYAVRGFVLDVGRKFIPMDFLRRVVKAMSAVKLNTLHIHLNDNQIEKKADADWSKIYAAFRLECETCPELTAKDGHYTKAEFREFQKWAKTLGVTVVPEIDVPAHALAFTRVRPEFASKKYGEDHFDLDRSAEILAWLEPIFAEYLTGEDPVFIGPYCHVGTDEYNKKEAEKFRAFTDAMLRMVRKYGYKACAWGALTHAEGQTPVIADRDITLDIWHNPYHQPLQALGEGYSIVSVPDGLVYLVPKAGYYYDFLNIQYLYEHWEPNVIGGKTIPADHPGLRGGKFALWNDMLDKPTLEELEARILHALPVMGQKMWSGEVAGQSWAEFSELSKGLAL